MKLTDEQKRIIKRVGTESRLKIEAFAGTGKTTTLQLIARLYPQKRFLVLAFNKAIADELRRRLGLNTIALTTHSLAIRYLKKNDILKGKLVENKRELLDNLSSVFGIQDYGFLRLSLDAFEAFCNSDIPYDDFDEIALAKLVNRNRELRRKFLAFRKRGFPNIYTSVSYLVRDIYDKMVKGEIPFTHNFYLKRFVEVKKEPLKGIDCILLDEAQDVNPVQIELIKRLNPQQFILVGDRHQSIYGWRGAINSMEKFDYQTEYLTRSFRFADDLPVELANRILSYWKGEKKKLLRAEVKKEKTGEVAYIFRTNLKLVTKLMDFPRPYRTIRPLEEIFSELFMAEKIVKFFRTKNREYLKGIPYYVIELAIRSGSFGSFMWELSEIDPELFFAVEVAKEFDISRLYDELMKKQSPDAKEIFLTAHTAKGLEFDTVIVENDFPSPTELLLAFVKLLVLEELEDELDVRNSTLKRKELEILEIPLNVLVNGMIKRMAEGNELFKSVSDEVNLAYVTVTRAIHNVYFSSLTANPVWQLANPTKEVFEEMKKAVERRKEQILKEIQET